MGAPVIPPRLWLIQLPDFNRNLALVEAQTPTAACDRAARMLDMAVGAFRPLASASGDRLGKEGQGETLFAIDVTGVLTPADADDLESDAVLAKIEAIDDFDAYIAPYED